MMISSVEKRQTISLLLCGDVMTGRDIDQIQAHPSEPTLHEDYIHNALGYVRLAEKKNGPIPRHVSYDYIWGEALQKIQAMKPDAWIINLETSVTTSEQWLNKGINYRMHPANVSCLEKVGVNVCALANNHVLDWGQEGLIETMQSLRSAGLKTCGIGRNKEEAATPAILNFSERGRILVFSFGCESSGIPETWQAKSDKPGVNFLRSLGPAALEQAKEQISRYRSHNDLVVMSIHWGGNWGYEISQDEFWFAKHLIDEAGVDVVYGHSSHHVKGFEIYKNKLILYGCGDVLNDYEGIGSFEIFHSELPVMFYLELETGTGKLKSLKVIPMKLEKFQLKKASRHEVGWIRDTLNREGRNLPSRLLMQADLSLKLSL